MSARGASDAVAVAEPAGVTIRRLRAHEWPAYRRLRLRSLADAPHAFGSTLALEQSWQPALWMARVLAASMSSHDCPLVAYIGAAPHAAAIGTRTMLPGDAATQAPAGMSPSAHAATRPVAAFPTAMHIGTGMGMATGATTDASGALCALLWAKRDPVDAGVVNLFQMWVAPEARGRGVGAALLQAAIAWARSTGAHGVRLGVVTDNAAAARLYARAGFCARGAPAPIRPGASALEQPMQLDLGA